MSDFNVRKRDFCEIIKQLKNIRNSNVYFLLLVAATSFPPAVIIFKNSKKLRVKGSQNIFVLEDVFVNRVLWFERVNDLLKTILR